MDRTHVKTGCPKGIKSIGTTKEEHKQTSEAGDEGAVTWLGEQE